MDEYDDGPYWVILLMYGSHDMRHTGFRRLTIVNGTLGFWGVTIHMNSETLRLLFTATQIVIFSTWFKAFEIEFMAKTSLRTFLTIYMALSQRLTRVGKDSYLLELSELHQIGVHA